MKKTKYLDNLLLPYQQRFVGNRERFKIWVAARQVGKSTAVAYEAVSLAGKKPLTTVLLVSASQRQSHELLAKVRQWMRYLKIGLEEELSSRESRGEICLDNHSRIISLPANPDTIRGFSGHIFLDEFSFHRDSERIWAAVLPMITRGYKLRITSTPLGKQNMFYRLWAKGGDHWQRQLTNIYDACDDGLNVDIPTLRQAAVDADSWAQEYECAFLDETTAFLTYDLIAAVEDEFAGDPSIFQHGPTCIGADIGRRRDLTVYWVLELVGDVRWTREVVELKSASFAEQDQTLNRLFHQYRPRRLCMDQTGLGEKVVEDARTRYGRNIVEGLLFTGPVKQDLALGLRRACEDRTVRVPSNRNIREDLHRVRKIITVAGNIRFDADRSAQGHADRFWALALAVHAADTGRVALPNILTGGIRPLHAQLKRMP
jgi:phage FluMu gp28-like protein